MLSVFVHVDAVGSTEFLSRFGVAASVSARSAITELVASMSAPLDGGVVATRGDGTLLRFGSAAQAIGFGLAVQGAVADQGAEFPLALRVGVAVTDDESEPEAMVAAERVEAACPPGRVAVDGVTLRAAASHLTGIEVESLGDDVQVVVASAGASDRRSRLRVVVFTEPVSASGEPVDPSDLDAAELLASHGGTVIDANGNGHVVAFDRCSDALAGVQAVHEAAAEFDDSNAVRFRIGAAVGDVASTESGYVGRAVVEAARLASDGEPGSTSASHDTWWLGGAPAGWRLDANRLFKGLGDAIDVRRSDPFVGPRPLLALPQRFNTEPRFDLVGRDAASELLDRAASQARTGRMVAVCVSGPEGVGKTRLVRELVLREHAAGASVLVGACAEDSSAPFGPLAEALRRATSLDQPLADAVDGRGPLASMLVRAGSMQPEPSGRTDMSGALNDTLERLASRRPTILVIDDLQWASADVTELLTRLLSEGPDMRLLVVVTCRDAEVDRDHPVHRFLAVSRRRRSVEKCPLDPLSPRSVAAMLASRAGAPLAGENLEFAHHIERVSSGNPLYVEELITHFVETGILVEAEGRWTSTVPVADLALPDTVVELMAARIARLGPDAERVLGVAAVAGSSFDISVVSVVVGQPLLEVVDVVEAAESAGLVAEEELGDRCTFTDELVRNTLLRTLRPTRRALTHQQLGEALERLAPDRVDELAVHWQAAIGAEADRKALGYLRRAGARDMAAAAWESSAERHQRILELLASMAGADDPTMVEASADAHLALGLSTRAIGADGFRPALVEAGRLAKRVGRGDLLGQAAIAMMRPGAWFPEAATVDDEISMMCEDALLILDPGDPLRARVLAALATNLAYHPDADRRTALVVEAQELARAVGDRRLIGTTLAAELMTSRRPDQFARRAELAERVRAIGRETDDEDLRITGGIFLVLDAMERGDVATARVVREELAAAVARWRTYWPRFLVAHMEACLLTVEGDPAVDDLINEVHTVFADHPVDAGGVWTIQVALRAMQKGTMAELIMPLTEMASDEAEVDEWARKWNYAVAKAQLDSGDPDAAMASIADNPDPDFDNYWMASVQNLGMLGLTMRNEALCRRAVEILAPYRGRFAVIGLGACMAAQVSTAIGQARLGLGDVGLAEELFRESLEQALDIGSPYFECEASRFLAQTLLEVDPSSAEAWVLLDRVAELASEHGYAVEAAGEATLRAAVTPSAVDGVM